MDTERTPLRLAKALAGALMRSVVRLSGRKVGVALLYHSVEHSERQPGDVLVPGPSPELFANQLEHLRRHYRVVPASQLQEAATRRRRGGRIPVAITFDDDDPGYTDTVLPLLQRVGLPASFFLNGSSLERPTPLWWRQLQAAWDAGMAHDGLRQVMPQATSLPLRDLGTAITVMRPEKRARVTQALTECVGSSTWLCGMSSAQVREVARAGFELGFHTHDHDYLPLLSDDELRASLTEGRQLLEAVAGGPITSFAYPSGEAGQEEREAARAAGYRTAFTTESRSVWPHTDPLALGRISPPTGNVSQLSLAIARTAARAPR